MIDREVMKKSLVGHDAFRSPSGIFKELSPKLARKHIEGYSLSCWELLKHTEAWQKFIIEGIQGMDVDIDDKSRYNLKPTQEEMKVDDNFTQLVDDFQNGIKQVDSLIDNLDFKKSVGAWKDASTLKMLMILINHNSYHLGQIMMLKKILQAQK